QRRAAGFFSVKRESDIGRPGDRSPGEVLKRATEPDEAGNGSLSVRPGLGRGSKLRRAGRGIGPGREIGPLARGPGGILSASRGGAD
ncbi:MAG TPA: hypothetical protein VFM21_06930, partial [Terriglobia bacterium]|nr:hypothetical protein [Terriglobia bacterium]